ncbi:dna polymerase type-y hhh motif [Trichococcus flocculiformis]|uniref:DNA polymerase IV n=1 Tax=Trichococcus flocculiformis TaxID=82803 RepID=A0AB38BE15_9LACT|nr:DNA polymerase IV [Trichococcus flocculiformis]CZQ86902.1 dna polymerase type-y hhh motif [Trichococcus flocculiformis]SFH46699.1 DNA polymerase-4 [Trichococcus flocculiformis]
MQIGILTFKEPENDKTRKIIHVDMDAFYASIEERDHPEHRGKPIVIANHPRETGRKGVVTTANYIARKFGIHSAMSAQKAFELCPEAIFISPRMNHYKMISRQIRGIFARYTDLIEPLSLDEAYLDVTQNKQNLSSATVIARRIQREVWQETGLTCSAGVSYNKFIAKIASDYQKPAGLTVITPDEAARFLWELPIEKFYGVGKKTVEKMKLLGIHAGEDLYLFDQSELISQFGKHGYVLYQRVRGIDNRAVEPERERKSIGKEHTFIQFLSDEDQVRVELKQIAQAVHVALHNSKLHGRTMVLKIRYADFDTLTRRKTRVDHFSQAKDIFQHAWELWLDHGTIERHVRLLGITITQLDPIHYENIQLPLWNTKHL